MQRISQRLVKCRETCREREFGINGCTDRISYCKPYLSLMVLTGRSRLVFTRLCTEGVNPPSEARGYIALRGRRLGSLNRVTIVPATRWSSEFDVVCTAIHPSFPGTPGWLNWKTESRMSIRSTWISEVTHSLNPIQEGDAVEVLAAWMQPRTAMTQEKLSRCLRTPVYQHLNSTSITKNCPRPDLAKLAGRTRCCICREVGHFSRNCPKKRAQASGGDAGVVSCDLEPMSSRLASHTWRSL